MPYSPQLDPFELQEELDELEALERSLDPEHDSEASGDGELDADDRERLAALRALAESIDGWPHVSTFVHEDDFENHAYDLAEDICGDVDFDRWPMSCIDWKLAAENLKSDYSSVEFDGETYFVLS